MSPSSSTAPIWILGTPRSASTLVAHALTAAIDEPVTERFNKTITETLSSPGDVPKLNKVFVPQFREHFGDLCLWRVEADWPTVRWVRLTRRDKVAQTVSLLFSHQTRIWNIGQDNHVARERYAAAVPNWGDDAIRNTYNRIHEHDRQWQQRLSQRTHLTLVSEDLTRNPHAELSRLFAWLGIEAEPKLLTERLKNPHKQAAIEHARRVLGVSE